MLNLMPWKAAKFQPSVKSAKLSEYSMKSHEEKIKCSFYHKISKNPRNQQKIYVKFAKMKSYKIHEIPPCVKSGIFQFIDLSPGKNVHFQVV